MCIVRNFEEMGRGECVVVWNEPLIILADGTHCSFLVNLRYWRGWRLDSSKYLFEPVLERLCEQPICLVDYLNADLSVYVGGLWKRIYTQGIGGVVR
jgi:hypothetical protein